MKKTLLTGEKRPLFPEEIRRMVQEAAVYDTSCSDDARVYYAENGLYVKTAAAGTLAHEARMGQVFHGRGLGLEVVGYLPLEKDWLVTREVKGEDLIHALEKPLLLCEQMAESLRFLHTASGENLPEAPNYGLYRRGGGEGASFEKYVLMERFPIASREEAARVADRFRPLLKKDVLIHGDACLPNMIMENGRIISFIDFSASGAGDRHMDLFWAVWSLAFNLKTEQYTDRFLDAYGKQDVDEEMLRAVSAMEALG